MLVGVDLQQICSFHERVDAVIRGEVGFATFEPSEIPISASAICANEVVKLLWPHGAPVSQNRSNEFICRVEGINTTLRHPNQRGYLTKDNLPNHSDRCDVAALYCESPAHKGGDTIVIDMHKLYQQFVCEAPDLSHRLHLPFPYDLRGERSASGQQWSLVPIVYESLAGIFYWYSRYFINTASKYVEAPTLSQDDIRALDKLDELVASGDFSTTVKWKSGMMLLLNSHRTIHGRTAFVDQENGPNRLLFRIWLSCDKAPRLGPHLRDLFGRIDAAAYRGGVWSSDLPLATFPEDISDARRALLEKGFITL